MIDKYIPQRNLQLINLKNLVIPHIKHNTLGERSFRYASRKIWNSLPKETKSTSLLLFKSKLKTFLFKTWLEWNMQHSCVCFIMRSAIEKLVLIALYKSYLIIIIIILDIFHVINNHNQIIIIIIIIIILIILLNYTR